MTDIQEFHDAARQLVGPDGFISATLTLVSNSDDQVNPLEVWIYTNKLNGGPSAEVQYDGELGAHIYGSDPAQILDTLAMHLRNQAAFDAATHLEQLKAENTQARAALGEDNLPELQPSQEELAAADEAGQLRQDGVIEH